MHRHVERIECVYERLVVATFVHLERHDDETENIHGDGAGEYEVAEERSASPRFVEEQRPAAHGTCTLVRFAEP
jgi:hypothetical protein